MTPPDPTENDYRILQHVDDEWRSTAFIFGSFEGAPARSRAGKRRRAAFAERLAVLEAHRLVESLERIDNRGRVVFWRKTEAPSC